jgi:deoxyribodipyrimidine photo-lyase
MTSSSIVWFRQDLRLAENPALHAAVSQRAPVLCVYIWAPEEEGDWPPGAASRWWLHHSLTSLDADLRRRGSRLIVARGPSANVLSILVKRFKVSHVYWNSRCEPASIRRDRAVATALTRLGAETQQSNGAWLFDLHAIKNAEGRRYRIFTQFWNRCLTQAEPARPLHAPTTIPAPTRWPTSLSVDALELLPRIHWTGGLEKTWKPGAAGAKAQLRALLRRTLREYAVQRDIPGVAGTSRLSPHLHYGEISPRQIWHAVKDAHFGARGTVRGEEAYLRQLGWREFAHYLILHFPDTPCQPLRPEFKAFPWRKSTAWLKAWQRGRTGYPLVDAGMRELWATGWMHNRARMIVASFLIKDLLQRWQDGACWFWDTLADADLANNTLGWQWVAGCGADAAPFFRIFNPVVQGERFDPAGAYVRKWVPELAKIPAAFIHKPWLATAPVLAAAGVTLGKTYPRPLVDHSAARNAALDAFQSMRARKPRKF